MNIYVRYFDQDALVYNFSDLLDFLSAIPDIRVTEELTEELRRYVESDMPYPKRIKVRPRVYFILIKTMAETMEEFKSNRKQIMQPAADADGFNKKEQRLAEISSPRGGWYKGTLRFKRVIQIPGTVKFRYQDTEFIALVKTHSAFGCYERLLNHLKQRTDIDQRSQFPSAKGQNFEYEFLGDTLPAEVLEQAQNPALV